MSGKLAGAVWDSDLPAHLKPLAAAMVRFADDDGREIYASVGKYAWCLGVKSIRGVQEHLRELRELEPPVLVPVGLRDARTKESAPLPPNWGQGDRPPGAGRRWTVEYCFIAENLPQRKPYAATEASMPRRQASRKVQQDAGLGGENMQQDAGLEAENMHETTHKPASDFAKRGKKRRKNMQYSAGDPSADPSYEPSEDPAPPAPDDVRLPALAHLLQSQLRELCVDLELGSSGERVTIAAACPETLVAIKAAAPRVYLAAQAAGYRHVDFKLQELAAP